MLRAFANGTFFGETYGEGPVRVLWLHGWGRQGADFAQAASLLAQRGIASVALDLPGFGASPLPAQAGGARMYADMLAPVLPELSSEPLIIVGHSFGGRVAAVLAAEHTEAVRSLVLTGAPLLRSGSPGKSPLRFRVLRALFQRGLISNERMEKARQRYGSRDYRAATGLLREILVATINESYGDELQRIAAPVTFVWGADEKDVSVSVAQEAMGLVKSPTSLTVLPGVDHHTPLFAPAALVDAVMAYLS